MAEHEALLRPAPPTPTLPAPTTAWMWLAALSLALATLYALAVVIFRLPFFAGALPQLFRTALVLHVELAIFVFLLATMAAQWTENAVSRANLTPPLIAALGTTLLAVSPLAGGRPVMLDYFPIIAGNVVFTIGFCLICLGTVSAAAMTITSPHAGETLRLSSWAVLMTVLATLATASQNTASIADAAWAAGHTLLFAHVITLGREWTIHAGDCPDLASTPLRLLAFASGLMPVLALLHPPGTSGFLTLYTGSMSLLLWPPILWLIWRLRRTPGPNTRAVGLTALPLSMTLFIVGCLLGPLIHAPTTLITAHYHATMGAVAVSRMAMVYHTQPDHDPRSANRQLITYALGLSLLVGGLALAAIEGAPRKTAASELIVHGPWFTIGMSISGLGGMVAMIGTVWWVFRVIVDPNFAARRSQTGVSQQ